MGLYIAYKCFILSECTAIFQKFFFIVYNIYASILLLNIIVLF